MINDLKLFELDGSIEEEKHDSDNIGLSVDFGNDYWELVVQDPSKFIKRLRDAAIVYASKSDLNIVKVNYTGFEVRNNRLNFDFELVRKA